MVCGVAVPSTDWIRKDHEPGHRWLAILQVPIKEVDGEASKAPVRLFRTHENWVDRVAQRGLPEPGFPGRHVQVALLVGKCGRIRSWVAAPVARRPERVSPDAVRGFGLKSIGPQMCDAGASVAEW